MLVAMAEGWAVSPSLNTLSMTDISVLVVSRPQKALQSFTTIPAPIKSLPRFTVPACAATPPPRTHVNNGLTRNALTPALRRYAGSKLGCGPTTHH